MNEDGLLVEIEDVLGQIEALLHTEQEWEQNTGRQLSVERLWILAGNAAERYRRSAGLSGGVDPYEFRSVLAHQTPSERRPLRVWEESRSDTSHLLADVRAARHQG